MPITAPHAPAWTIRRVERLGPRQIEELAALLVAVVHGGASVGFMAPLGLEKARRFWQGVDAAVRRGERALLLAELRDEDANAPGRVVGTVQLLLEQPENQPHRADLAKMQVAPEMQRQGLGAALMQAAEDTARACGKTVLVLDTVTGSAGDRLYTRMGWQRVGEVPHYALWPDGRPCPTTYFHKQLT
ncbi:GNAT family N-acetyltransferase [Ideonella dechloratans]|uniref:GNAT family N-acetyltransferase n=1 Tax=Ideonella dechloratans TaxID=36863 RepID=UPI0035B3FEEA